jgi:hypothetical protein
MSIQERHVPDKKRNFSGEHRAMPLVMWLNNTHQRAAKARVVELNRLLVELVEMATWKGNPDPNDPKTTWNRLQRRINLLLRKYPVCEQLAWFRRGFFVTGRMPLREMRVSRKGELTETGAVMRLLDVFRQQGPVPPIGLCGCGTYFFRRFSHQRFCSEVCRLKEFRSSEKWKAHRRAKARDYYWMHKNKNTK